MKPELPEDLLENCLRRLQQGAGVEEILAEIPEQANELRPLLLAAAEISSLSANESIPRAVQNRSRARFLETAAQIGNQSTKTRSYTYLRFASAGLIVIAILGAVLLGTGLASAQALPGDVLYPVKLIVERWQINAVRDAPARLEMEENFDNRRLDEAVKLSHFRRRQPVSFSGQLILTDKGEWQVGGLTLSFPPDFPPPDILIGTYVQVNGYSSDNDVVEIKTLSPRQFEWSGILESVDFKTWLVNGVRLNLDDQTKITGSVPQMGSPVNVIAVRLADDLFQAVAIEVGMVPILSPIPTRMP